MLEKIKKENDIKRVPAKCYSKLAHEIRDFLIAEISNTGGHLASNLGAVELTMALHLSLDLPTDKIIWDVGHQSYTHKILTGRREGFVNLRGYGGMSGFPKTQESPCDVFNTGHSSTSISAGLGLVEARDIKGEDHTVVAVIGDGSMTGGMAYEALNNVSHLDTNYIIVLNDNKMSIAENVGGMSKYLNGLRTATGYLGLKECMYNSLQKTIKGDHVVDVLRTAKSAVKQLMIPGMFFEDMDITYLGPVDGHDVELLKKTMEEAKRCKNGVLVHVITEKGHGYEPAMKYPTRFHGTAAFDIETGLLKKEKEKATWTDIFSRAIIKEGRRDKNVVAITAAMPDGTGLKRFSGIYPKRFFDVGIAEQHAVTFAAGLAAGGLKPVVAVYSSFLQRAYDQVLHDVCIQNLPVVFALDRAGLVGSDGETHQGIFDLSFLSSIPNMTIVSPKNKWELADMMKFALKHNAPITVRYPRGSAYEGLEDYHAPIELGKSEVIYEEKDVVLFSVGHMMEIAIEVREKLLEQGKNCSIVNARFVAPIDKDLLVKMGKKHKILVTLEENVASGGYGEHVSSMLAQENVKTKHITIAIPNVYVDHGNVDLLRKDVGLDAESILERIIEEM